MIEHEGQRAQQKWKVSRERQPDPIDTMFLVRVAIVLALILGGMWLGWIVMANSYRQQHCIYLLGLWLSVERMTNPMFCQ